jgi:hypothetical protein
MDKRSEKMKGALEQVVRDGGDVLWPAKRCEVSAEGRHTRTMYHVGVAFIGGQAATNGATAFQLFVMPAEWERYVAAVRREEKAAGIDWREYLKAVRNEQWMKWCRDGFAKHAAEMIHGTTVRRLARRRTA